MPPLLPDFYYSLKTKIFFGPTQGPKLFQNQEESAIPWSECGVVILHGNERPHLIAIRETVEALMESSTGGTADHLRVELDRLDENLAGLYDIVSSLPFDHVVFVSIGGHEVMQKSQHFLHQLTKREAGKDYYFVVVPTSLGRPSFISSELFVPDHSQRLGLLINDDVAVAHAVWFNPTFTLKSPVEIDSVALLGEVLSRFATSSSALESLFSHRFQMNYSIYWYYIPQILACIDNAYETPEAYESRALFIWNSVIASLPVMYPQFSIVSGESNGLSQTPGGAIKETVRICSVLFPNISPTRIQAEITYALFNHLLTSRGTETFGSLPADLSVLLQDYWAEPLHYWKSKIAHLIGPLELPDAVSRLIAGSDSYGKEESPSSVALWNILNSVRITAEGGTSLISPQSYAHASALLNSLE